MVSTAVSGSIVRSCTPTRSARRAGSPAMRSSIRARARAGRGGHDLGGQIAPPPSFELACPGESLAQPAQRRPERVDALVPHRFGEHDRRLPPGVGGEREHGADVARERLGTGLMHLVDGDHIGDLHDPRLQRLHRVAGAGHEHENDGVRDAHHLDLALTGTDRLEEDDVPAARIQQKEALQRRLGEAAQMPTRAHRADEHTGIEEVIDEPDPVAEQCPLRERAGRVDGDDAYREPEAADVADERGDQRRLAHAGRAGDPDREGGSGCGVDLRDDRSRTRVAILHERDRSRERPAVTGTDACHELLVRPLVPRHAGHSTGRAGPFRTADAGPSRL